MYVISLFSMQIYTLFCYSHYIFEINSNSLTIFITKTAKWHHYCDALGSFFRSYCFLSELSHLDGNNSTLITLVA